MTHRPLVSIALFFGLGIFIDRYMHFPFWLLASVGVLSVGGGLVFINRKRWSSVFIAGSLVVLGALCSQNYQYIPKEHVYHIAKYYRKTPVTIEGVVASDVQKRNFFKGKKTIFELRVTRLKGRWGWQRKTGKVLATVFRDADVFYGDKITLEGKLYWPFNFSSDSKFSYRDYLRARQIRLLFNVAKNGNVEVIKSNSGNPIQAGSIRLKNRLSKIYNDNLSEIEAGLMQALILGDRYDIPRYITDLFVETGTAHILAISGFNVGIVAALIFLVLRILPIGRKAQYVITILLLIAYAFLTGLKPPVVRATIMAAIFIASYLIEREADPVNSLALAALIILTGNPLNLFDIGFQLSFVSVLAIILYYSFALDAILRLSQWFSRQPFLFLTQSMAVSLVAWLGVAGLIAYYFHIVTPVTILANLIVIPLISMITALGLGLLAVAAVPWCPLAFAFCIKFLLNVTVGFIYLFSQIPGSCIRFSNVSLWQVVVYYFIVVVLTVFWLLISLTKKLKYDKVNHMKRTAILSILFLSLLITKSACAFWIWTPETNKWVNPKYDVKETPQEQLAYAKGIHEAKDDKKAIAELEKLIKSYPKAKEAAEARFLIGSYLEAQGRLNEAFKAYQKVVEKYPFSERFTEVIEKEYQIGEKLLEGETKERNKFVAAMVGGEYNVIDVFRAVIKNAPYGKYAAPSQYKIGLYLSEKGLHQEARDEFEKVINDYPDSEWVKAAKYQIALVDAKRSTAPQYDQKITKAAVEEFKDFTKTYPDAELSQKAHDQISKLREKEAENNFLIAHFYEKQKKYPSAKIYYEGIVEDYQGSPWAAKAAERLKELAKKTQ